ncbi:MAG: acyl-CoA dehydrogenase family protein [Deltaproteobacteria bacterium]|nr:acyl-CoA dehydrogenase family protein [Deltaproteobacteria bacterium]
MADFPLAEEQRFIWESAARFARDRVAPDAAKRDREHRFPFDLVSELAQLGLLGVKVQVEDGGSGADMTSYVLAISEISRACASTAVTMAVSNLVADILSRFASLDQKQRWLEPFLAGRMGPASFALSEPSSGSDAAALQMTAVRDGDAWVLNGSKQWITNGTHASFHLLFARVVDGPGPHPPGSKGITCFVVERGAKGLDAGTEERKMGLRSSNTAQLHLTDVRVPAVNVVGEVGKGYAIALSGLDTGRIGIAAQALGIMEAALAEGVRYAKERKAFGKALAEQQATQFAIADSRTDLEQSWLLTLRAAADRDRGAERTAKASSMAKLFSTEACGRVVDRMLQIHGGYGYVEDYPIERLYRDARVTRIYEGTSEVQRIVIARELLAG